MLLVESVCDVLCVIGGIWMSLAVDVCMRCIMTRICDLKYVTEECVSA